jgi:hypothetical protein
MMQFTALLYRLFSVKFRKLQKGKKKGSKLTGRYHPNIILPYYIIFAANVTVAVTTLISKCSLPDDTGQQYGQIDVVTYQSGISVNARQGA